MPHYPQIESPLKRWEGDHWGFETFGSTMQSEVIKFPINGALSSFIPHIIPINCAIGG